MGGYPTTSIKQLEVGPQGRPCVCVSPLCSTILGEGETPSFLGIWKLACSSLFKL